MDTLATFVTYDQCTEMESYIFTTEASTLGFPPGQWPVQIDTDMGNALPFHLSRANADFWTYKQEFGLITLRVFND